MALRACPVCMELVISRPEVKTCGGEDCMKHWKGWNTVERNRKLQYARMSLMERLEYDRDREARRKPYIPLSDEVAEAIDNLDPNARRKHQASSDDVASWMGTPTEEASMPEEPIHTQQPQPIDEKERKRLMKEAFSNLTPVVEESKK